MRFLKVLFFVCAVLGLVYPASAQYYKSGNETMVRVMIHYKGPEISPYINHDAAGIALKEGAANRVKSALQSLGGRFTYGLRYANVLSGSIPTSRLTELGNLPDVLEITKDRIWTTADFDPFSATPDERKAWVKDKAAQIKERMASHQLLDRVRSQGTDIRNLIQTEQQQGKNNTDSSLVNKAIRVQGTDSTVDPGQFGALLTSKGVTPANYLFYNHGVTNAADVWNDANQGDGIIVALIDSGTYSAHPLLSGSVIGSEVAPGLAAIEAQVDVNGDGVPDGRTPSATDIINNPHGTGTACMIAGHGVATFPSNNRFLQSVKFYAPASVIDNGDGTSSILVFGSAPKAKIYAIKVFPYPDGGSPSSVILAGMDRAIQLREDFNNHKPGGVKIDVANMSLGGPDLFQGFSAEDKLADSMVAVGIQPVISAGNAGPAPFTISEPGASLKAITVGAIAERKHFRILEELFFPQLPVGGGGDLILANQFQNTDFSSHGPLPTGYGKPDLSAEGNANFTAWLFDTNGDGLNDTADTAIVAGTSFSSPTTAGGVALLTKLAQNKGLALGHQQPIKAALLSSARTLPGMDEDEVGKGLVDFKAAADFLTANPTATANPFNTRKSKFKGVPIAGPYPVGGGAYITFGTTGNLKPGEQDDFLIPNEQFANDEAFIQYLIILGLNPQRVQPFPGIVRPIFDALPNDGLGPVAAQFNNTEIFIADGINTGFSDGDYFVSSLNQVDTYYQGGGQTYGVLGWYTELFPALTLQSLAGYVPDQFGSPITSTPSGYGSTLPHQQFGNSGRPDYTRLTFMGDGTNDSVSPVAAQWVQLTLNRSAAGLTLGTPSFTGSIKQNQVKDFTINLPAPTSSAPGYSFRLSFRDGWNGYKFPATPGLQGIKRQTADLDLLVIAPDGSLLNESGLPIPGFFQGASLNDVETIHDLALNEAGKYQIEVVGFGVKGVAGNSEPFEIRIWDGGAPIIP